MTRARWTKAAWLNRRDGQRAVFALICFGSAIAFATLAPSRAPKIDRPVADAQQDDDEIYTGSIVFMPVEGNRCRQNLIDNITGRIRDNGVVACDEVLARGIDERRRSWSAARIDAVRDGFRPR